MTHVESTQWSGLPSPSCWAVFGLGRRVSLGVIPGPRRRSKCLRPKIMSILYIELIRACPCISPPFMSSIIFPLFLPEGITINKILRARWPSSFHRAYIAEVVREGGRGSPGGQYEAAESLGLNYVRP